MDDDRFEEGRRIAIELERLNQEVRVIQHVLDDAGAANGTDEMIRRLRHLAGRAERLAALVESAARSEQTTA